MNLSAAMALALEEMVEHGNAMNVSFRSGLATAHWSNSRGNQRSGRLSAKTARALINRDLVTGVDLDDYGGGRFEVNDAGRDAHSSMSAEDFERAPPKLLMPTEEVLVKAVKKFRLAQGRTVAIETSVEWRGSRRMATRRADALILSPRRAPIVIEIKASRGDWLSELRDKAKPLAAAKLASQFYYAAPYGVIRSDEVPKWAGLIEISPKGFAEFTKGAPRLNGEVEPDWRLVASIARGVARAAERGLT